MPTAAVVSASEVNRQTTRPFSKKEQIKNPLATNRRWRARGEDLISFVPTFYSGTSSIAFTVFNRTRVKQLTISTSFLRIFISPACRPASMSHSSLSITTLYTRRKRFCKLINRRYHQKSLCSICTLSPWITIYII